jgi:hypothetical protein
MQPDGDQMTGTTAAPLIVADWVVDAEAVTTACRARLAAASPVQILVPAWLHGLDWAGDPFGSVPCAERQLERITRLCEATGFRVASATVGDPDPVTAIGDAVARGGVERVLLFARGRHVSHGNLFGVRRRAERVIDVPVEGILLPCGPLARRRRAASPPALRAVGRATHLGPRRPRIG